MVSPIFLEKLNLDQNGLSDLNIFTEFPKHLGKLSAVKNKFQEFNFGELFNNLAKLNLQNNRITKFILN
jgi:hypothetical protein